MNILVVSAIATLIVERIVSEGSYQMELKFRVYLWCYYTRVE